MPPLRPRPVRVLRIITRLNVGGPAQHVVWLSRGLERFGYRTLVLTGCPEAHEASMERFAQTHGVAVERVAGLGRAVRGGADLRALVALWRACRRTRPHIVHTHTAKAGALGRIAASLARVPVRVHTFHGHVLEGYFSPLVSACIRALERGLAATCDRIVALSPGQRRALVHTHRVATRRQVIVVPLGIDARPFVAVARTRARAGGVVRTGLFRRRFGIPARAPLVGAIGRLVSVKRLERLIAALAPLTHAHLLIAGVGPLESALRARAQALGTAARVHFAGLVRPVAPLYAELDLLALTSAQEGTPVVILEALAAGVPVVASAVGGVPDLARAAPGAIALLEPEADEARLIGRLRERLAALLADPAARARMAACGRVAASRFSLEGLLRRTDRLYRALLGRRWRDAPPALSHRGRSIYSGHCPEALPTTNEETRNRWQRNGP